MSVVATLDGVVILTGKVVGGGGIAFWTLIELDEVYDFDETIRRLDSIYESQKIHYECRPGTRRVHLPPAYRISSLEAINA